MRHAQACARKCQTSAASRKIAMTVDAYMESSGRACSALCLWGPSGCGKSMFVAENVMRLSRTMHAAYHKSANRNKALQDAASAAKEAASSLAKFKEMGQQVAKTLEVLRASPFVYVSSMPAIIVRFIGLTCESRSIRNLMSSICQQMHFILIETHGATSRAIPPLPPIFDLESMKAFFSNMLRTWNNGRLILFLDGLNHLDDADSGRVLDWLPTDGLSAMVRLEHIPSPAFSAASGSLILTISQVRLIVTTSSPAPSDGVEEPCQQSKPEQAKAQNIRDFAHVAASEQVGSDGTSVFHEDCYALLKDRITKSMMVECPAMEELGLLQHILALYGRTLTEAQYTVLLQVIRRFPRQQAPIIASVLVQRFIDWPSHIPMPGSVASAHDDDHENAFFDCRSIGALCVQLFQHIEARHGRQLVRFALSYISLARLASLNQSCLNCFRCRTTFCLKCALALFHVL
jgi:hypothetical protein